MNPIRLAYTMPDGSIKRRTFKTMIGARTWAQRIVGEIPTVIDGAAIGCQRSLIAQGITMAELFPLLDASILFTHSPLPA